ncbi:MAG: hypothetical protein ACRDZO_24920 [Egibacteraceae bacterium]
MAKHEITIVSVAVDKDIVDEARLLGIEDIATVANKALREHVERLGRLAALDKWIEELDEKYGPPSEDAMVWAAAACDEAEAIADGRGAA